MKEKDLTAYCGLYCGDCIRYKSKASDLADEMLNEIEMLHLHEYANIKQAYTKGFENFDRFTSTLEAISKIKCELPCRLGGDGCDGPCEIIKCVKAREYEGCWECNIFEKCEKLDFLKPFHGKGPLENLHKIKEYGLDDWAEQRTKCYPWI